MRREQYIPERSVVVMHKRRRVAAGSLKCILEEHIQFDADVLKSYITRSWEPVIYDGLLLAAVVEFCDRAKERPKMDWARKFTVDMPVHEPDHWNYAPLKSSLVCALECLTGDRWDFKFRKTRHAVDARPQECLPFPSDVVAVIPFSDGLDSLAVSAITRHNLGDKLIKVRVGASHRRRSLRGQEPFAAIPFKVSPKIRGNQETSFRTRGFKFAMISGLAAYLIRANRVIVPESGQGALGPVLVNVGHGHPDRRTHPQFTHRMSKFLQTLLDYRIDFEHQAVWGTKGETLATYRQIKPDDTAWRCTRSCWQDARQASVNGRHRQCGVCAACLLRRLSLHAAEFEEASGTYVWDNLDARSFWQGADRDFAHRREAQREYALAGVLHLDHLADLPSAPQYRAVVERQGLVLSRALDVSVDNATDKVVRLINQHALEWRNYLNDLSDQSFVRRWAKAV